jgi:hypothetical protein
MPGKERHMCCVVHKLSFQARDQSENAPTVYFMHAILKRKDKGATAQIEIPGTDGSRRLGARIGLLGAIPCTHGHLDPVAA